MRSLELKAKEGLATWHGDVRESEVFPCIPAPGGGDIDFAKGTSI